MLLSTTTVASICAFILGLGVFVYLCFTKTPRIFSVLIAVFFMSLGIPDTILNTYFVTLIEAATNVVKGYLAATLAGAVVGCAMGASGCAASIAEVVMDKIGRQRGVLVIMVASALVCASGALGHTFIVLPIALAVCRQCNIPRGVGMMVYVSQVQIIQFNLVGIPAFPQLMPAEALGITIYGNAAQSIVGVLVAEVIMYFIAMFFCKREWKKGKGFEAVPEVDIFRTPDAIPKEELPNFWFSLLPLIFMIGGSLVLSTGFGMGSTPAAVVSQAFTTIFLVATCRKKWHKSSNAGSIVEELGESMMRAGQMILTTCFIGGMGGVIAKMTWYNPGLEWALGLNASPYLLCFIVVAVICFITSDAIAGIQMFLSTMAPRFMAIPGINLGGLHRVICATSCSIESMPWTAGCYNYCSYYGISVKSGWKFHFFGTVGITTFLAIFHVVWSSIAWPC